MGSNPHANGGELLQPLSMPHFHDYAVVVPLPGSVKAEATRVLGTLLRDVMKLNLGKQNFRLFGPDETASNRLEAVYEVSGKEWMADVEASIPISAPTAASWKCSASTCARVGLRATC